MNRIPIQTIVIYQGFIGLSKNQHALELHSGLIGTFLDQNESPERVGPPHGTNWRFILSILIMLRSIRMSYQNTEAKPHETALDCNIFFNRRTIIKFI